MVVLRAIGAFFVKIGRWIKETAWVQPLLIVGGIFAIIFTIPYIVKWVGSWFEVNEATAYYNKFNLSINGENSKGDQLFSYLQGEKTDELRKKYGEKFFITFVSENGDNANYYEGYEILASESKKTNGITLEGGNFKLYTIYIDEKNDDKEKVFNETSDNFYNRHQTFFELTNELDECPYSEVYGTSSYQSSLLNLTDPSNVSSNTCFLIDLTDGAPSHTNKFGVSEIIFSVSGSDKYNKAYFLRDCWNHAGDFAAK